MPIAISGASSNDNLFGSGKGASCQLPKRLLKQVTHMRKIIMAPMLAFAVVVLSTQMAQAQGTLYFSNLGQPSAGSAPVGSDSWVAADIQTGTNAGGYLLNSVQLALADAMGNPSAFTVMLYASGPPTGYYPGGRLGTLNGSLDPVASGIYTYSPTPNLSLSPHTVYWVVLTAGTPVADGAYEWSFTSIPIGGSGGWIGTGTVLSSSDGLSWGTRISGARAQFAMYATDLPVPEPSMLGLLALGGGFLVWRWRKAKVV
jgi:hypothetical protein